MCKVVSLCSVVDKMILNILLTALFHCNTKKFDCADNFVGVEYQVFPRNFYSFRK